MPDDPEEFDATVNESTGAIPIYMDDQAPELEDPARPLADHQWQPGTDTTSLLTRCLEAIRTIDLVVGQIAASFDPRAEKRILGMAITPIHNLAIAVDELASDVQRNHNSGMNSTDQRALRDRARAFRRAVPTERGPLHDSRNAISSHLDKREFTTQHREHWESFSIDDLMRWIRECIRMLTYLVNVPDAYTWVRESGRDGTLSVHQIDGNEVMLHMKNGEPTSIVRITKVTCPMEGLVNEVQAFTLRCAMLCKRLKISV